MPFSTVKLMPGVKALQTPTLLQANVVASNMIRWRGGLPEKYGGWMNFFGAADTTVAGVSRELCAWADLDLGTHLAVAGTAGLRALSPTQGGNPANQDITPQYAVSGPIGPTAINATAAFTTSYSGIAMPPNPGWVLPGMTVTDTTSGHILGTVKSYAPLQVQVSANSAFFQGSTTAITMLVANTFGVIPGMMIFDQQAGYALLGTVQSWIGTALVLTAPSLLDAVTSNDRLFFSNGPTWHGNPSNAVLVLNANMAFASAGANDALTFGFVGSSESFVTTAGSPVVTITDPGAVINQYGSVSIQCHIPVGGIILFGSYPITAALTEDQYTITLPVNAVTGATATPACVATFTTVANSQVVTVALTKHGLVPGASFSLPIPTAIGANGEVTLEGFYPVQQVVDADHFIIFAQTTVPTAATKYEANFSGAPQITYWVTQAPILPNTGWGLGGWGVGGWGQGTQQPPLAGNPYPPPAGTPGFGNATNDDWSLANWGSELISAAMNGALFAWDPISGIQNAQRIGNGPDHATGFFIGMPEQQIIVYGASTGQVQDPMLVAFCDNANYNVWTAATSNQAGTYRLTRGSKIVGGIQGPQQAMLWTDVGLWTMVYIGYPNVFGFNEVAQGCGLIGKHAIAVYGPQVFWMARDAFWMYTNGAVQRLPCDVWDVVIKNLNNAKDAYGNYLYFGHIRGAANSGNDEIAFHFPSKLSANGENDSWVKFNTVSGEWDYSLSTPQQGMVGSTPINVTAWIDNNLFGHPISSMLDPTGLNSLIMQHEMGEDANGQAINWMIQTGFFMLSDGEDKVFVDFMIPDFRWRRWQSPQSVSAQVQITLYTAEYPDDPEDQWTPYGPFVVTNATGAIEPRCRGRYFLGLIQGNDLGSFVRLGGIKFRFAPDGRN